MHLVRVWVLRFLKSGPGFMGEAKRKHGMPTLIDLIGTAGVERYRDFSGMPTVREFGKHKVQHPETVGWVMY